MQFRPASFLDSEMCASMALLLWPRHTMEKMKLEMDRLLTAPGCAVLMAFEGERPIAFCQCQLRHDYVEGASGSPTGYLEGIYVRPEYRRRGVATELLRRAKEWAAGTGCHEFASDCELKNEESRLFHIKAGFQEAGRIICFIQKLD